MAKKKLSSSLSSFQMQMIALGGTIGVGLFLGSAAAIQWTGPSILISYILSGLILYIIMRALGEMMYLRPITGSFADFASDYIHPFAGFLTAWSNIFQWVMIGISEVIAIGQYLQFWWPKYPTWITSFIVVIFLALANLASVKVYGKLESWLSLIKVFTIIIMFILGMFVILFGFGNHDQAVGISNLWSHGGFFTGGFKGFMFSLSMVIASYQGIEILGITAGEADNAKESIIKSVRSIVFKVMILYVGAIFVILAIYPWNQMGNIGSPFVKTFSKVGITFAAGIINFVVLTAALSGCNSGVFSASRMMYTLAENGDLPKVFTKVSKRKIPYWPVVAIVVGILIGSLIPVFFKSAKDMFVLVFGASVLPGMIPWFVILISHLMFVRRHEEELVDHPFRLPGAPWINYVTLVILVMIVTFMFFNPETTASIMIGLGFEIVISGVYVIKYFLTEQ
ncbi:amino acid permease [Xylocopilactobacillus apicola]|uniref:Amino acid permease n=1 Tax=Xylocopilactobacillus apicola TaxID=2932184 RepID=A0AAU9DTI0_9LACO|nr:amino acid permease [Xylocopilactobacillus apicola]BDR58703.1 amino acid permease [Xylocopilactobacillus apicola]